MNTHDINFPPLRRPQVPRIDADIDLADIRRLADWCEKTARSYARAATEAATAQLRQQLADTQAKLAEALAREEVRNAIELTEQAVLQSPEVQRLRNIEKAALGVLNWTQATHRPPVREAIPCGETAAVRVHALADLHDALHPDSPAKTAAIGTPQDCRAHDAARVAFWRVFGGNTQSTDARGPLSEPECELLLRVADYLSKDGATEDLKTMFRAAKLIRRIARSALAQGQGGSDAE